MSNSTCVATCPSGFYGSTAIANNPHCAGTLLRCCELFSTTASVAVCSAHCLTCSSATTCSQCSASTYLYHGACVSSCPVSTYTSGHNCAGQSRSSSLLVRSLLVRRRHSVSVAVRVVRVGEQLHELHHHCVPLQRRVRRLVPSWFLQREWRLLLVSGLLPAWLLQCQQLLLPDCEFATGQRKS